MSYKQVIMAILLIVAPIIGFAIAPADITAGDYSAEASVVIGTTTITETIYFLMGSSDGDKKFVSSEHSIGDDNYTLTLTGQSSYDIAYNSKLTFSINVICNSNETSLIHIPLENIWLDISGPDSYSQRLQTSGVSGDSYEFSMRIPVMGKIIMALLFLVAVLWFTEIIPLEASSLLIPVMIVVLGVTSSAEALKSFFDPVIALFLGGFLIARAMRKHDVDKYIALKMVSKSSLDPKYLMLSMMGLSAFLSLWMSNTASTAVLVPIAVSILERLGDEAGDKFKKGLVLGIAYAATIGGIGSAIGTPANPMAIAFLSSYADRSISFVEWFLFGIPFVIPMLIITWVYLVVFYKPGTIPKEKMIQTKKAIIEELQEMGDLTKEQKKVFVIFGFTVFLWLFQSIIVKGYKLGDIQIIPPLLKLIGIESGGMSSAIVALIGAVLLFVFGLLKSDDVSRINWSALLIFGGGLTLGNMIVNTGVSDWMALQLGKILPSTGTLAAVLIISVVVGVLALIITMFASNTASAAMIIPLAIPLAAVLNIDPTLLVVIVAMASSVDFALVIGTPPTMIAFSTGYFNVREVFKIGIILDIIGIIILTVCMVFIWAMLGLITI